MKMIWKALLGFLRNNFWMKIAALGIACVLWFFVISETNPPRIKEFHPIPVTFTNAEVLKSKGLTSLQDLSQIIKSASATVVASTNQLKYLESGNITLTVDLSGISSPGEYKIPIKGSVSQGNVTVVSPSEVTVDIENVVTSQLPVDVQLVGSKKANLYYGQPKLNKSTVQISGARSKVEKYSKAVCYIDLQDLAGPVTESKTVQILDANGNSVQDTNMVGELPSVIVSIDVYPKKEVPIDTQELISSITGIADGYKIDGVVLDPATVELAGPSDVLDKITKVSLEKITLNNASVDSSMQAAVIVPQGVVVCEPTQVAATVQISMVVESKTYQALDVQVKNLPSGLKYTLMPQSISVTVTGSQKVLEGISASKILPFVDLSGLGEGTQNVAVQFENEPDIGAVLSPVTNTVMVKLEKR
jgi:YbbR domain-containing protein